MATRHTTLRVNDALMRKAKAYARRHNVTLTAVMERALAAYLGNAPEAARRPVSFRTSGSGGTRPGVDLDDSSRLMDVMDGMD